MRKERIIHIRVEDRLGDAIDRHAEIAQVNPSALIRSILRSAFGLSIYAPPDESQDPAMQEPA